MSAELYIPIGRRRKDPFVFKEFFEMGLEESASPFLNPVAKRISYNLALKASIGSAILLAISFACSFFLQPLAHILLALVFVIAGTPLLIDSVEDIVEHFDINIDVLMTVAAFSAYFLGAGYEGALLLVLFSISGSLEHTVSLQAKNALSSLYQLAPTKAYICKPDGSTFERAVQDVEVGDIILVRAGEIVPLDGMVVSGSCSINLQHLTGENTPIYKKVKDAVPAGAKTIEGSLTIQVTHTSNDSTLARIVSLMMQAQERKPKLERWFDRFGRIYAMSIISFSIAFALYLAHVVGIEYRGTEGAIYRSLAFLITASPCALIIAVPTAYLSALGASAKRGLVLKGGVVFDALNTCSMIAFDKTGTLTLGELSLVSIDSMDGKPFSEQEVISISAALERNAVHPIAKAIVAKAEEKRLHVSIPESVRVIPGVGIEGIVDGKRVFIGDVRRASQEAAKTLAATKQQEGLITALLTIDTRLFLLSFSDKVRPGVPEMLASLQRDHKILMLTGDHRESARQIAEKVGIREFYADLKPEDKLNMIERLSKTYGLAMVGDGVNDAPALARASVGIALGKIGSATTQSVADVILLHDSVEILDWLFAKAQKTKKIVMQNLAIAMSVIVFASIPALAGMLPLWLAVILHEGGTVLVALNAIRLLKD